MVKTIDEDDTLDTRIEYIGPFGKSTYVITVGGYKVPYVEARKIGNGLWTLLLDDRFAIDVTEIEISAWMWWIANAMAVAAGYSCFGSNSTPFNRFSTRMIGLSADEMKDVVEDE